MEGPSMIDQKTIDAIFLADQPELFYRPRAHVVNAGDDSSSRPALLLHSRLIAPKQPPANDEPDHEGTEKRQ
jgi:hypothetical protein